MKKKEHIVETGKYIFIPRMHHVSMIKAKELFIRKLLQLQRKPVAVGKFSIESEKRRSAVIQQTVPCLSVRSWHPPNKSLRGKTLFDEKLIDLHTRLLYFNQSERQRSGTRVHVKLKTFLALDNRQSRHKILLSYK